MKQRREANNFSRGGSFFAKGKKRGWTVTIKGRWPRSKVSHCDLIVVPFGPFKKRLLYFITLGWNVAYFSERFDITEVIKCYVPS